MRPLSLLRLLAGAAALLAMPAPTGSAADKEANPLVAKVKAELKDPTKPLTLTAQLQVKEGMQSKLEAGFSKAAKETARKRAASPTT